MSKAHLAFVGILLTLFSCKPAEVARTETTATTATTATTIPLPLSFPLDHYKFWKVRPQSDKLLGLSVMLKGQFDDHPWKATVKIAQYIANPVEKKRNDYPEQGIRHENLHYVVYSIDPDTNSSPAPAPQVDVTNQFGTRIRWTLGKPAWLLAPADKKLDGKAGEPPPGDHFVCYAAEGQQAQIAVTLMDQFDEKMHRMEELRDFPPAYFCVPVTKQRDGRPLEDIRDHETHLAVYKIAPVTYGKPVWTNDQFGPQQLNVSDSEYLGVPSRKEVIKPKG